MSLIKLNPVEVNTACKLAIEYFEKQQPHFNIDDVLAIIYDIMNMCKICKQLKIQEVYLDFSEVRIIYDFIQMVETETRSDPAF